MLAEEFGVDHSTIVRHLQKLGKVWKRCGWVPHELTQQNKDNRVTTFTALLERHEQRPFLHHLITGDENAYEVDSIPFEQRAHPYLGISLIVIGAAFQLCYLPCIFAMCKSHLRKEHCYKLMIYLSIIDVLGLSMTAICVGVFHNPHLHYLPDQDYYNQPAVLLTQAKLWGSSLIFIYITFGVLFYIKLKKGLPSNYKSKMNKEINELFAWYRFKEAVL
uniref:HTH_48 domain-containing protein n=1 Tax=Ditylenchus dipsaci TaxID=166011 RepID=A0A915DPM6_9BILA